jgi:putative ABC transport system ATP-binding protein
MTADELPSTVSIKNVNHYFGEGSTRNQVLFDNSLEMGAGELVIMSGPSGSGKTTLLTLIGGLRAVQEGAIRVLGRDLVGLTARDLVSVRQNVGFIFQMHNLFESLSAYNNVRMAMQLADCPRNEMRRRGTAILERLNLGDRIDYKPRALSGGQRQRVAVARALVNQPKLVLADEPTAALDKDSTGQVVAILKELVGENGSTILMVTHDSRILEVADRIVRMVDGRIVSDVRVKEVVVICEFLRAIKFLEDLGPAELTQIAERMTPRRFASGDILVREGEAGEEFFLMRSGTVEVIVDREGHSQKVAELSAGEFFGEQALMTGGVRNATVRAKDAGIVYTLGKPHFEAALKSSPEFSRQLRDIYFQRQ